MAMAPIPVVALLAAVVSAEITIFPVVFAQVYAIRTVFAVTPLMIVTMIAIVVARMADFDHHLLCSSGSLGRSRNG